MARDILAENGFLFLGSRMKRLAERMQADALKILAANGFPDMQPAHMPVLYALNAGPMTVSEIVARLEISQPAVTRSLAGMTRLGFVELQPSPADQRQKIVSLTGKGRALSEQLKRTAWRDIAAAAENLCRELEGDALEMVGALESRLAETPLTERTPGGGPLEIVGYSDALAHHFYDLNAEWIRSTFSMEASDEAVLSDPRGQIIDRGGDILFVKDAEGNVIGAGALQPVGEDGDFELTKMAVSPRRRGEKAGELLLVALIRRARQMGVEKLHLLTNRKCTAAIPLYEKMGFVHCEEVMRRFGAKYARADVAMRYPL
ncbi:MAG: bifunctional helix-turn-helix transcriptional regulator/GNAT family N-acetyltransferase [Hyphomonadaceae bacterium]